jgi:hypothetical protein
MTYDVGQEIQPITLTGIASNAKTTKPARVTMTAQSSNPGLIKPSVKYSSTSASGELTFKPAANAVGTANITVVVNSTTTNNFQITITNAPPTIDPVSNVSIPQGSPLQSIYLTGITSGSTNEHQRLKVLAISSNPALVRPTLKYTSPLSSALLTFKPAANTTGTVNITVIVNDGITSVETGFTVTILSTNNAVASDIVKSNTPVLSSMAMNNGSFTFQVTGSPGSYVVQASSDLTTWAPVSTNSIPAGSSSFTFSDNAATNYTRRFYRAFTSGN